jgi:hypothetical protein
MNSIGKHDGRVMLEEHIAGAEYRATVVDGHCVAVTHRLRPYITGDGRSSIAQLLEASNKGTESSPYWGGVKGGAALTSYLARQDYTISSVPGAGDEVCLSNTANGVQHEDVTDFSGDVLRNAVERAARSIGLVTTGIDVIMASSGEPVILELNQRSYIGFHSFPKEGPGQGNAVAEAIVDYYFPETIDNLTHANLAYDFAPVRAALDSAQISELSLPVIGQDWKVLRFAETGIAAKAMAKLLETAARTAGVFTMSAPHVKGGVELCLAYAPANFRNMLSVIPAQFWRRLEQLDAEVKG